MAEKKINPTISREGDGTIVLTVSVPQEEIKKSWEKEVDRIVQNAEIQGFRKGKAPRSIVEKQINKAKVREDILRDLLPKFYTKAIEEHSLKPIISPHIHVEKVEDKEDWVFSAKTCELPDIKLNDYKKAIGKLTAKSKIIIPGKEEEQKEISFDQITEELVKAIDVVIPQVLIDNEVDRLLSQMLDEIKKLGLSLDQYLASTGKDVELVKKEFAQKAKHDLAIEFALQKIAEEEKITVEPQEIQEAIAKAKSEEEKLHLQRNIYLLASILRQQKTFDFLKSL